MRRLAAVVFSCGVLCSTGHAAPVLHQRIYFGQEAGHCKNGVCTSDGPRGAEVTAVEQDGRLLQAPQDGAAPLPGEQVFHGEPNAQPTSVGGPPLPGDPPPERRGRVQMDRATGADVEVSHSYHAVFTPSVFPYKRMSSLDWADERELLGVFDATKHPLQVLGPSARREADHDAFWGSVIVDLEPGRWVPIPSVSADPRVLTWRTEPPVAHDAIELSHDAADNVFVRATPSGGAGGQRRFVWLTESARSYFAGPLPRALLGDEPRSLVRPLPASLQREAEEVLQRIGVHHARSTLLADALVPLVAYFRAFEAGDLPPPTASTYRDLALGKKGVCRHRAYAFVITALAAGIPARYVENELHVFVEVYLPGVGWRRINLGGAAADEQLASGDERPLYHPRDEDPLPRPPEYAKNALPPDRSRPSPRGEGQGSGAGKGDGHGARVDLDAILEADRKIVPGAAPRTPTITRVAVEERTVFRGDTLEVSGEIVGSDGMPVPDLPVELYLDGGAGAQRIGAGHTGPDGRFGVAALISAGLELGHYTVVARTPGDKLHAASSSRAKK